MGFDIPAPLRQAPETIGIIAHIMDVHVAFFVQGADQCFHRPIGSSDKCRFFVLGVTPVNDVNIEPEARKVSFSQRPAQNQSSGGTIVTITAVTFGSLRKIVDERRLTSAAMRPFSGMCLCGLATVTAIKGMRTSKWFRAFCIIAFSNV